MMRMQFLMTIVVVVVDASSFWLKALFTFVFYLTSLLLPIWQNKSYMFYNTNAALLLSISPSLCLLVFVPVCVFRVLPRCLSRRCQMWKYLLDVYTRCILYGTVIAYKTIVNGLTTDWSAFVCCWHEAVCRLFRRSLLCFCGRGRNFSIHLIFGQCPEP